MFQAPPANKASQRLLSAGKRLACGVAEGDKVKILAVDDQPANLVAIDAVLGGAEYELIRAHSGSEALEALRQHPDTALVLMDVQMPIMDGFETARQIKEDPMFHEVPIIFISAIYTEDPFVKKGFKAGGVDYFTKPFDPEVLKLKVAIYASFRQKARLLREREMRIKESEELLRAGRKLRAVFESLPVGVVIANTLGHIGQTNEEVLNLLKSGTFGHSDSYGAFLAWWEKAGSVLRAPGGPLTRALSGHSSHNEVIPIACFDGTTKSFFVSASPLRNIEGNIVGAVLVLQDATEQRKIEADFDERIRRLICAGVELEESAKR